MAALGVRVEPEPVEHSGLLGIELECAAVERLSLFGMALFQAPGCFFE
jgi:hypothetical protein